MVYLGYKYKGQALCELRKALDSRLSGQDADGMLIACVLLSWQAPSR